LKHIGMDTCEARRAAAESRHKMFELGLKVF